MKNGKVRKDKYDINIWIYTALIVHFLFWLIVVIFTGKFSTIAAIVGIISGTAGGVLIVVSSNKGS